MGLNALFKAFILSGERITKSAFRRNYPFEYYPIHVWVLCYALDEIF